MLDKEDPAGGGGGLSSSGVASPSLRLFSLKLFVGRAVSLSSSDTSASQSSSSASTVSPNSFLSRSVKSSRFGSGGGDASPIAKKLNTLTLVIFIPIFFCGMG